MEFCPYGALEYVKADKIDVHLKRKGVQAILAFQQEYQAIYSFPHKDPHCQHVGSSPRLSRISGKGGVWRADAGGGNLVA